MTPYLSCRIEVTFKDEKDGSVKTVKVPIGTSLLEAAHENHIDLEGEVIPSKKQSRSVPHSRV